MSIPVFMSGLPGSMGRIVANTALERGLSLVPWALTGEQVEDAAVLIEGQRVQLLKPKDRDEVMPEILRRYPDLIAVDYTHPSSVNQNAEFYVRYGIPFVMGTTGGDRKALMRLVFENHHPCVIAPNMAKQIVAFQAMIEYLADNFPGAFSGYKLSITESHQKTKADTSGTAKAIAALFRKMGLHCDDSEIRMIRREDEQTQLMGVPVPYLNGHAFHTYTLDSPDGTVHFEFRHNVLGRKVYAQGTIDAVLFLAYRVKNGARECYTMMDVLRSGAMR